MIEYLTVDNVALLAAIVVTLASALRKGLELATDIKPSDRLDGYASRLRRFVATIENVLDKLALNPRSDD